MDKQHLLSIIDKYHLNGIVEKTKWSVKDQSIDIIFAAEAKDLVGQIVADKFEGMEDQELIICNTSQLYKLINITGQFITLNYKKDRVPKLLIADNQYNLEYVLGDPSVIKLSNSSVEEPEYTITFAITKELINGYIKAKKALGDTDIVTIESAFDETQNKVISFTIGNNDTHSHKVNFNTPALQMDIPSNPLKFNAAYIKEIFDNNKDAQDAFGYLNEDGLLKMSFKNESGISSIYYIVARD
jgi:hypothetical protein